MGWLTNEILFYGGMVMAGGALAAALVFLYISHIKRMRLDIQLEAEYGKRKKKLG